MSRRDTPLGVRELLDSGKEVPRQPDAVRARVLERARKTAAAPLPDPELDRALPARSPIHAAVAAGALALGGAAVVLGLKAAFPSAPVAPPVRHSAVEVSPAPSAERAAPSEVPDPPSGSASARNETTAVPTAKLTQDRAPVKGSYAAELELMRSAHNAFAAHDYAGALALTQEHARRFPNGVLAEEREAVSVRSLAASGHTNEARRAAAAFAKHFPRSVLARRLLAEVGAGAE
jgi:hypothetical protein